MTDFPPGDEHPFVPLVRFPSQGNYLSGEPVSASPERRGVGETDGEVTKKDRSPCPFNDYLTFTLFTEL